MNKLVALLFIAAAVAAAPATSEKQEFDKVTLSGYVEPNKDGKARPHTKMTLHSSSGQLLRRGMSDEEGRYQFTVRRTEELQKFKVCAHVSQDAKPNCVPHRVQSQAVADDQKTAVHDRKRRALLDWSTVTIPGAGTLAPGEARIQLVWAFNGPAAQKDWDNILQCDYEMYTGSGDCLAAWKEDVDYFGYCEDVNDFDTYTLVDNDASDSTHSVFGVEAITIVDTAASTYKHFVYGHGSNAFKVSTDAQGFVRYYKGDPNWGSPILEKEIDLADASYTQTNEEGNFWHVATVDFDSGELDSVTETNSVECDPSSSTGSTATIPGVETGITRDC